MLVSRALFLQLYLSFSSCFFSKDLSATFATHYAFLGRLHNLLRLYFLVSKVDSNLYSIVLL